VFAYDAYRTNHVLLLCSPITRAATSLTIYSTFIPLHCYPIHRDNNQNKSVECIPRPAPHCAIMSHLGHPHVRLSACHIVGHNAYRGAIIGQHYPGCIYMCKQSCANKRGALSPCRALRWVGEASELAEATGRGLEQFPQIIGHLWGVLANK